MKTLLLTFLSVVLMPMMAQAQLVHGTIDPAKVKELVDAEMRSFVDEERLVGSVVLVAVDGEVIYEQAMGYADREANIPMQTDMLFRLASMTKPIVSVAAMALVDQGVLELDAPVTRWLPYFTPKLADGSQPEITLRHLMTHTAGLSYPFLEEADSDYHRAGITHNLLHEHGSAEAGLRLLASVPLRHAPGEAWRYSFATDVLGEVIAQATGKPLPQVVAETVTDPLGMTQTGFVAPKDAALVTAYAYDEKEPRPVRMGERYDLSVDMNIIQMAPERVRDATAHPSGGSGMVGTARDYLTFLEALRQDGAPILSADATKELLRNQLGEVETAHGPGWGWSLTALVLHDPFEAEKVMSAGTMMWSGIYGTNFLMDKTRGVSIVVMTNTALVGTRGPYPRAIRRAVYTAGEP